METQLSNLLQSLFETDGKRFFKTPTFYIMKLFKAHLGQYLTHILPDDLDPDLDTVATVSEDGTKLTASIVNRHLYEERQITLNLPNGSWHTVCADIVTSEDVRAYNTFDEPLRICARAFSVADTMTFAVPRHSVIRLCLERA